uniref:Protein YIF1 n=1 Tax=Panagrellus redivivus TaxID=6233 RepID=A0A7E4V8A3_PANRE
MSEPDWNWGYQPDQTAQAHHQGQPGGWAPPAPQHSDYYGGAPTPQAPVPPTQPNYSQWDPNASVPTYDQSGFGGVPAGNFANGAPNAYGNNQFAAAAQGFMGDPMFNAAKTFGGQFAEQQKQALSQYISSFNLKYYFAVDTKYVGRKIGILLFPFAPRDWSTQFGGDGKPVPAKLDVNAPDLYVPLMAFITYVLISGFVFGVQQRFSPEQLGMQTTNALFYLFLENMIVFITKYVLNISQSLSLWHTLAFTGYKFVGIVVCLVLYLLGGTTIYYCALVYMVLAITIFLARSLKSFVLDMQSGGYNAYDGGRKRKMYMLLSVVVTQALIMYLLTSSVTSYMGDNLDFAKMALSKMGVKSKDVPMTADGEVDYEALLKMP